MQSWGGGRDWGPGCPPAVCCACLPAWGRHRSVGRQGAPALARLALPWLNQLRPDRAAFVPVTTGARSGRVLRFVCLEVGEVEEVAKAPRRHTAAVEEGASSSSAAEHQPAAQRHPSLRQWAEEGSARTAEVGALETVSDNRPLCQQLRTAPGLLPPPWYQIPPTTLWGRRVRRRGTQGHPLSFGSDSVGIRTPNSNLCPRLGPRGAEEQKKSPAPTSGRGRGPRDAAQGGRVNIGSSHPPLLLSQLVFRPGGPRGNPPDGLTSPP